MSKKMNRRVALGVAIAGLTACPLIVYALRKGKSLIPGYEAQRKAKSRNNVGDKMI